LRTAVLLSNPAAPPKVILVTSALPQEGKTTTIVNLALAFAQQGRRVLLVDADLRRPAIHRILNTRSGEGLGTMLSMGVDVQPVVPISSLPNLHVLTAGTHRTNAAELLSSPRMYEAMEMWRKQYDHVFIDSPPALAVTDAVVMSVWADCTMVVVRSGVTSKAALRRVRALFDHVNANVLGAVLNAVDLRSPDYYYYYYAGSKYGSYYHDRTE
jgi:capsular exopolysaccharide synthesis family protein